MGNRMITRIPFSGTPSDTPIKIGESLAGKLSNYSSFCARMINHRTSRSMWFCVCEGMVFLWIFKGKLCLSA